MVVMTFFWAGQAGFIGVGSQDNSILAHLEQMHAIFFICSTDPLYYDPPPDFGLSKRLV